LNGRQPAGTVLLVAVDVSRIVGFANLRHRVAKGRRSKSGRRPRAHIPCWQRSWRLTLG
jgi:hypothetical protein